MKAQEQSLQKLTKTEQLLKQLVAQKKVTSEILEDLSQADKWELITAITQKADSMAGEEQDLFLSKMSALLPEHTKAKRWEYNHARIIYAISTLIPEMGRMPRQEEIANKAELSRQTVSKHLKEYGGHELFAQEQEAFKILAPKVLTVVFRLAMNGDLKAAKLYLQMVGGTNAKPTINSTVINQQNNSIEINGILLNQNVVNALQPKQLLQLESILKSVV